MIQRNLVTIREPLVAALVAHPLLYENRLFAKYLYGELLQNIESRENFQNEPPEGENATFGR